MSDPIFKLQVRLNAENLKKWLRKVKTWDFSRFLNMTGETLLDSFQTNIRSGGRGVKWPPLDDHYRAWKSRKWGRARMLVASGKLFNSLRKGGQYNVYKVSKNSIEVGTDVRSVKNFPYWRPVGEVRKFIMIQPSDKEQIGKGFNWEVHKMLEV